MKKNSGQKSRATVPLSRRYLSNFLTDSPFKRRTHDLKEYSKNLPKWPWIHRGGGDAVLSDPIGVGRGQHRTVELKMSFIAAWTVC